MIEAKENLPGTEDFDVREDLGHTTTEREGDKLGDEVADSY